MTCININANKKHKTVPLGSKSYCSMMNSVSSLTIMMLNNDPKLTLLSHQP